LSTGSEIGPMRMAVSRRMITGTGALSVRP
jgi:hypothetical protein